MAVATERLSGQDLANLLVEAPDTPMHMAVLTVFEGDRARLPADQLLERLQEHVRSRLDALPELRRALQDGGLPGRRPIWEDDRQFRLEEHVRAVRVAAPGGEEQLLEAAGTLLESVLDRSRPLWELWLLTGLEGDRWATLFKVHHAVTDGYGMLEMALVLFDGGDAAARRTAEVPAASPASPAAALLRPVVTAAGIVTTVASVVRRTWHGRRADLLRPVSSERRVEVVRLDLSQGKRLAHAYGVKLNDVLLELAAAGIRATLQERGRPVQGVILRALMAVSPAAARRSVAHNRAASVIVSLPLQPAGAADRLLAIAADSRQARRRQRSAVIERAIVLVARSHLGRVIGRHQRVVDLAISNLVGPGAPLGLLGNPMLEAIPITPISGNVTIDFCALSYAGRLAIGILADAGAWPDLAVVAEGMRRSLDELATAVRPA